MPITPINVVVLTGAGISAESGIATFRASDGLWEQHRVEDVATPEGYARDPELVQHFYNERRAHLKKPEIQPNVAHLALVKLEKTICKSGSNFTLITQNVDDLHQRAGSTNVIPMHGELFKVRCTRSGEVYEWHQDVEELDRCTCCTPARELRPHIVWFGEMPLQMDDIYAALQQASHFISIGTSGHVYPAAGFVQMANQAGAHTVELNLEPSQGETLFKEKIYGPATQVVPAYVSRLLQELLYSKAI